MTRIAKQLDALDIAILSALNEKPRATTVDLSKVVHLSRTAISRRLCSLRDRGVFVGGAESISYYALGFEIEANVEISALSSSVVKIRKDLLGQPEVLSVSNTSGYGRLAVHVIAVDIGHLHRFVNRIGKHGEISTNLDLTHFRSRMSLKRRLHLIRSQEIETGVSQFQVSQATS